MGQGEQAEVCITAGENAGLHSSLVLEDSQFLFDKIISQNLMVGRAKFSIHDQAQLLE